MHENKTCLLKPARGGQRPGFTLIASLIVIVLIVIALFPLLRALSTSIFVSAETESTLVALNLAQGKLEEIRSFSYDNISSEARAQVAKFPRFQREVIVNTPQTDLKDIKVIVYWEIAGGIENNISFETYATNY